MGRSASPVPCSWALHVSMARPARAHSAVPASCRAAFCGAFRSVYPQHCLPGDEKTRPEARWLGRTPQNLAVPDEVSAHTLHVL